jgi:hypothetical protein
MYEAVIFGSAAVLLLGAVAFVLKSFQNATLQPYSDPDLEANSSFAHQHDLYQVPGSNAHLSRFFKGNSMRSDDSENEDLEDIIARARDRGRAVSKIHGQQRSHKSSQRPQRHSFRSTYSQNHSRPQNQRSEVLYENPLSLPRDSVQSTSLEDCSRSPDLRELHQFHEEISQAQHHSFRTARNSALEKRLKEQEDVETGDEWEFQLLNGSCTRDDQESSLVVEVNLKNAASFVQNKMSL